MPSAAGIRWSIRFWSILTFKVSPVGTMVNRCLDGTKLWRLFSFHEQIARQWRAKKVDAGKSRHRATCIDFQSLGWHRYLSIIAGLLLAIPRRRRTIRHPLPMRGHRPRRRQDARIDNTYRGGGGTAKSKHGICG